MNHFNLRSASKLKFRIFHVHTLSREIKKKRMRYKNKKGENGKLKIQPPSSLTLASWLRNVPDDVSGPNARNAFLSSLVTKWRISMPSWTVVTVITKWR